MFQLRLKAFITESIKHTVLFLKIARVSVRCQMITALLWICSSPSLESFLIM